MNNVCKILVWEDENLQWFANIANRLANLKPKWALKFIQKDSDYPLNKEPGLMDGWELLRSVEEKCTGNELQIKFEIYHSRGIEGENFSKVPLILTDIRLKNDYKADTKRHLGTPAPAINNEEKSRYGIKILGKKAISNNSSIILIVASDYIANLEERIHLIQEVGGNALNIYEKKVLKDSSIAESIAWQDCVVQQIISIVTQWKKQEELKVDNELLRNKLSKYQEREKTYLHNVQQLVDDSGDILFIPSDYLDCIIDLCAAFRSTSTVVLTGESGVGKSEMAKLIHRTSSQEGIFVPFDCSAINEGTFISELFGHEEGAFNGAKERYIGAFERAKGGTLFIDEIGNMPKNIQKSLLGALAQREIRRMKGTDIISISDVRLIFATDSNIIKLIDNKDFSQQLWNRISVLKVRIPPICERTGGAVPYAEHILQTLSGDKKLSEQAKRMIAAYHWPRNLHEIRNTIDRAIQVSLSNIIDCDDLDIARHASVDPQTIVSDDHWQCPITDRVITKEDALLAKKWLEDILDGHKEKISPGWIYWQPQNKKIITKDEIKEYGLPQTLGFSIAFIYLWWAIVHKSGTTEDRKISYEKIFKGKPEHGKIWQKSKRFFFRLCDGTLDLHESDLIKNGKLLFDWL